MLFDQDEPLGNREIRTQLAYICATLYNRYRAKTEGQLAPDDFMFRTAARSEAREVEIVQQKKQSMITGLRALAAATGGRTPRRRKKARRE